MKKKKSKAGELPVSSWNDQGIVFDRRVFHQDGSTIVLRTNNHVQLEFSRRYNAIPGYVGNR